MFEFAFRQIPPLQFFKLADYFRSKAAADRFGRHAADNGVRRYIARYYCSGSDHGSIADFDSACMDSAKAQVMIIRLLLGNDAEKAKYIVENAKPYFKSKEEYVACVESLFLEKDAVVYEEDGKVTLDI